MHYGHGHLRAILGVAVAGLISFGGGHFMPLFLREQPVFSWLSGLSGTAYAQDFETQAYLDGIGFYHYVDADQVKLSLSDDVDFELDRSRKDLIRVVLPNTDIPLENTRRPLETTFFGGPIKRIVARTTEGIGVSTSVEIWLSYPAPVRVAKKDGLLIDVQR